MTPTHYGRMMTNVVSKSSLLSKLLVTPPLAIQVVWGWVKQPFYYMCAACKMEWSELLLPLLHYLPKWNFVQRQISRFSPFNISFNFFFNHSTFWTISNQLTFSFFICPAHVPSKHPVQPIIYVQSSIKFDTVNLPNTACIQ